MNRLLPYLLLLLPLCATAQISTRFNGTVLIIPTGGAAPNFLATLVFNDLTGKFDGTNAGIGDKVYVQDGGETYRLNITAIASQSATVISATLNDLSGTLGSLPPGAGEIHRETSNYGMPLRPAGSTLELEGSVEIYQHILTDGITGGGGGGGGFTNREHFPNVTGSAVTTTAALPTSGTGLKVFVYRGGIKVAESNDYTISGNTITFSNSLAGENVEVLWSN